jgi:hypothetical protein
MEFCRIGGAEIARTEKIEEGNVLTFFKSSYDMHLLKQGPRTWKAWCKVWIKKEKAQL